jgi:hypothetical protein
MPHPKNGLMLTGDTHPPDVEEDLFDNEAALRSEILHQAEGGGRPHPVREVGHQFVVTQPLAVLGLAVVLGYIVTRLLSR